MARRESQLKRRLERIEGVRFEMGGQGHWKCYYQDRFVTTISATTRDSGRRRLNEIQELRRVIPREELRKAGIINGTRIQGPDLQV